jgi:two-component system CheB/CheR fusion protein
MDSDSASATAPAPEAAGSGDSGVQPSKLSFPVVGLGASAGGLAALMTLLESLPASPGMAFVVILHLSPSHDSNAAEILQKSTRMTVKRVADATLIEPDHVYVIPPTRGLSMIDGHLSLTQLERDRGRHIVIDLFFRTLAQAHRERSIAVILSGSGADGSVGIAEVKEQGGLVIAQSVEDAEFDGMPSSAIATGKVDIVLPVAEIGPKLVDVWRNARNIEMPAVEDGPPVQPPTSPEMAERALRRIMEILQSRTGHDFKHYKRATVLRRIERRLQVNGLPHMPAYVDYLESTLPETPLLLSDMLIGVTNFFRDRDAFEALERQILPALFDESLQGEQLRVWVAGCSSGEEAYSILMLLNQELANTRNARPLQVFATDIDQQAITRGREGLYPESIITDLPPALMRKYMSREGSGYRVNKPLRSAVLFAQHNVLRDPPFSKLDLISCRNLLIYLDREVQKEILQMFHFALRPGGYLFLGGSETADVAGRLFNAVDKRHRIYQASTALRASRTLPRFPLGGLEHRPSVTAVASPRKASTDLNELHQQMMVAIAPPSMIVKSDGELLHTHRAEHYLRFAEGVPTQNLLGLIQPELRPALRSALFQASHGNDFAQAPEVRLSREGRSYEVRITVRPVPHADGPQDLLLVVLNEIERRTGPDLDAPPAGEQDPLVNQLEGELQRKDEQLQRMIDQYERAVEDLKSSNEELQAINEELRSATEELETSKEELQSTNEELITVNNELKTKVEETAEINDDLQNLIAAIDIATVFVDRDMLIKRFTPAASRIFNIIAADNGRSLLDITHKLDYESLAEDARSTFNSLRPVEREVRSVDGRWYLARMLPYRTGEDRIDGAVLIFIDITLRRSAERRVDIDRERMQLIADSMPDFAIMTLDEDGLINSWSAGAERLFGYAEAEVIGKPGDLIFTPEDIEADAPRAEMRTARQKGRALDERWHMRKDGTRVFVSGIMAPMALGRLRGYAKIARDMTDRKHEEAARSLALSNAVDAVSRANESSQLKDEFLAVMSHELKHPLNVIQLNAQLLTALPDVQSLPSVIKAARTIQQTVRSQARIIDDLLDLSRTRTGKLVLNVAPLYLADALQDSLAWAAKQAAEKNITFRAELTDEPLLIRADPIRIEQVALNLLSNAIKFTPPFGRIAVRLSREDEEALLEVVDTGRGFPASFMPHIFQLFKQADTRTSREQTGLGIGLALVRELVELQGGSVAAESAGQGLGATFSVRLPLSMRTEFSELSSPELGGSLAGLRILYVEDSPDALSTFSALLQLEGAQVHAAATGSEALQIARRQTVDLVISDIGMPGMDGYQFMAELRKLPACARVPTIALTGYGRPKDIEQAMAAGFNAHLSKPINMDELNRRVQDLGVRRR